MIGKYFKCTCSRCLDVTELGTYLSSALCPHCKKGYISKKSEIWICHSCGKESEQSTIDYKVQCCSDKLEMISKYLCIDTFRNFFTTLNNVYFLQIKKTKKS